MSLNSNIEQIMGKDVAQMYHLYGQLNNASSNPALMAAESKTYETILSSVKGSDAVKQLAADYIPQFLHFFPAFSEKGLDAQMDLIEDEKPSVRIHAIKGLEQLAKNNPAQVGRIADVLSQLLEQQEPLELNVVKTTFASLFTIDAKAALLKLMAQASSNVDVKLRKLVLDFLQQQLKSLGSGLKKDEATAAALHVGLKALLSSTSLSVSVDELKYFIQALIYFSPHGNQPDKIRADEAFKAELSAILLVQSGIKGGALDYTNEAVLTNFLSLGSIVSNLGSQYGVDVSPFVHVFLTQILPNSDKIANVELREKAIHSNMLIQGVAHLSPKAATQYFPIVFGLLKQILPTGEIIPKAASTTAADGSASSSSAATPAVAAVPSNINFAYAEVILGLFHLLAPLAPEPLRQATGFFTPTGQPGENLGAPNEKRDEFLNRIQFLLQSNAGNKASLHLASKSIFESVKAAEKKLKQLRAIADGKQPKQPTPAISALAAGQPVGPEQAKAAVAPVMDTATAVAAFATESVALKELRGKEQAIRAAIRLSASIQALATPLLTKPLPKYLSLKELNFSWRKHTTEKPGQKPAQGGKPGQKPSQQQSSTTAGGKGQKRKSAGPDQSTKSASNKKRGAPQQGSSTSASSSNQSSGSQKKNKKQKQSNSNKGGQQQQNGGQQPRSNKKQKQSNSNKQGGGRQQRQRR